MNEKEATNNFIRGSKLRFQVESTIGDWRIQLGSATGEFVFAPEERDVYSYGHAQESRSVRSATRQRNLCQRQPEAIALLRSFGAQKGPLSYKHLAPIGAKQQ